MAQLQSVNPRVLSLRKGLAEYEQRVEAKFVLAGHVATRANLKAQDVRRPRRFQEVVVPDDCDELPEPMDCDMPARGDDSEMSECGSSQESDGSYSPASSVTSMELDAPAHSYFGPIGENTTTAASHKRKFDACELDGFVAAVAKRRIVAHPGARAHTVQPVPAGVECGFQSNRLGIYITTTRAGPFPPQRSASFP